MAKKKAAGAVVEEKVANVVFKLSPERDKELRTKLKDASDYYETAFAVRLSVEEIHAIMLEHIVKEKKGVFLKRIGSISEADVLWFAQEFLEDGHVEDKADHSEDGDEGRADLIG
mgnify:CR=1 FL=1